jgi:hypothetical protein
VAVEQAGQAFNAPHRSATWADHWALRLAVAMSAVAQEPTVGSSKAAVVDDASAGKDVVATKKPEAEDGAVAKPGEEEDEQEGNGMMREIYKHLLPVLAVVIVVAQLRKIYLTPAHHVGAVW